jgi:hypothetical protein
MFLDARRLPPRPSINKLAPAVERRKGLTTISRRKTEKKRSTKMVATAKGMVMTRVMKTG